MTRTEFNTALRAAISCEFAEVPVDDEEITYIFSPHFQQRINKLIKAEQNPGWHWVNTVGKRAAVIAAALLCLLSLTFSVEAVRVPVVRFVTKVFDGFWHIKTEGETTSEITYEFVPNYIPDGYTLYEESRSILHIQRTYTNEEGELLILNQDITAVNENYLDNEQGEISRIEVDGNTVILYKGTTHNATTATWIADGYNLSVTSYGSLSEEEILKIICNYR